MRLERCDDEIDVIMLLDISKSVMVDHFSLVSENDFSLFLERSKLLKDDMPSKNPSPTFSIKFREIFKVDSVSDAPRKSDGIPVNLLSRMSMAEI